MHHHAPRLDLRQRVETLDDDRRRNVVRKVCHELARVGSERRKVERQRVAIVQFDVGSAGKPFFQVRSKRSIELDGDDTGDAIREVARQNSHSGTDLQDDVVWSECCEPADDAEDVLVCEEVLPQLLLGTRAHGSENTSRAFASMRRASSAASSPRVCASAATVWTT